jgi:hypothetical protein
MDNASPPQEIRFAAVGTGFLIFGWFCYLLSAEGVFFRPFIIMGAVLFAVGIGRALWRWSKLPSKSARIAILLSVSLATIVASMTEPTIFSGRDQGSIATAAMELSRHGSIAFSSKASDAFFSIYGPGQALNFPGFFYTDTGALTTQFPLGYIAWLGGFFSLFGIAGLTIANAVLLALSLLSIFFFIRYFQGDAFAFLGLALAGLSFLPTWFAKFTLSENLALFLFVFLVLNLALFLREGFRIAFMNVILASGLLALTRIEGLIILPIALGLLYRSGSGKALVKENPLRHRTFPLASLAIILIINLSISLPFYRTIAKALYKNIASLGNGGGATEHAGNLFALWGAFFSYGLAPIFILGFVGIAFLAREKRWLPLLPAVLALPSFLYFLDPAITLDHPWMLRRFLPTLWPTLLICGVLGLALVFHSKEYALKQLPLRKKFLLFAVVATLFLSQAPAFSKYLPFAEGRGLPEQVSMVASSIGENDLLLVDRTSTGDPFAMPTGPLASLFGKNAVYFLNASDFAKLPPHAFGHIYLLAPTERKDTWSASLGKELSLVKPILFSGSKLDSLPITETQLPEKIRVTKESALFEIR